MKIRNGFVSNSSSSSFMIYGLEMDISDFIKRIRTDDLFTMNKLGLSKQEIEEMYDNDVYELVDKINNKTSFECILDYDNDSIFVGVSPFNISDDETGKEFKQRIKNSVSEIINVDKLYFDWRYGEINT